MLNIPNLIYGSALLSDPINISFWLGASWLGKQNMNPKLALQTFYNLIQTAAVQPAFTYLQTSRRMAIAAHIVLCTCTGQYMEDVTWHICIALYIPSQADSYISATVQIPWTPLGVESRQAPTGRLKTTATPILIETGDLEWLWGPYPNNGLPCRLLT